MTQKTDERAGPRSRERWHHRSVEQVLEELACDAIAGLSHVEARRRLDEHGENAIAEGEATSWRKILRAQFNSVLVWLLLVAAALSLGVGLLPGRTPEYTEAILILTIVVANAGFGFFQDYRAEQAMAALRELSAPEATVIREGQRRTIRATELVPGDLLVLAEGTRVSADARLVEVHSLETSEAELTGESGKLSKSAEPVPKDTPM